MKSLLRYLLASLIATTAFTACVDDQGNYSYLSEDEVSIIEIDTTGMGSLRHVFAKSCQPGDIIRMSPKVKYAYPENLKYSWIIYTHPYAAVEQGNTSVYPRPDTICHTLDIEWKVNVKPGRYASHLIVEDTVRGLKANMKMQEQYFTVASQSARSGVYILCDYDGQTDIDYYSSALCLIYGGDEVIHHFYSQELGKGMLPSKPRFISWGDDYYYVFTEEEGYRLNFDGLELMETFDDMFYNAPAYNPQCMAYINQCEALINNGKLHVLYTNRENDRKFSAPIGGDYQAGNYLSQATKTSWYPTTGAMNEDQVIYDEQSQGFRPYFPQEIEIGSFGPTSPDAYINVKKLPSNPLFMAGADGGKTYAILENEGRHELYIMNFFNTVDDGDLSGNGYESIIDLSQCEDIDQMKYLATNYNGTAFFYATEKAVYSFSPSSGRNTSNLIYRCQEGESISCLSIFFGHDTGGFPTPGVALWVGIWSESLRQGTLLEYEIDPYEGLPRDMWGPMFGTGHDNPYITTGYGKIISIASTM